MSDELMIRLAAARPEPPESLLDPEGALLDNILTTDASTSRRFVTPLRLASVAVAAAAAALVAVNVATPAADPPKIAQRVRAVNMQRIAESTSAALTSGRAHVTYSSDNGHFIHDSATLVIEFSGPDRSTVGTIDPRDGRSSAFPIANKVVDGRFFLQDGTRWVEDTNAHVNGSDLFSVDPRTFVSGSAQDAGFVDRGTATVDGVETRHLEATRLDQVPAVNLGLGPIVDDKTKVTKFEVWVDAGDVVRRLDLATSMTETVYPSARTIVSKDANGNAQKTLDTTNSPAETRTQVSAYSVKFTDIGAPIEITAPANAPKVAGQG